MDIIKMLYDKAKVQFISAIGLVLAFIFMYLPFITIDVAYYNYSGDFNDITNDLVSLVLLIGLIAALVLNGFVLYQTYEKKEAGAKLRLQTVLLTAIVATLYLIVAIIATLTKLEDEISMGYGFFLFVVVTGAVAALNGMKALANKEESKKILSEVSSKVSSKVKEMSDQVKQEVKSETTTPAQTTETKKEVVEVEVVEKTEEK